MAGTEIDDRTANRNYRQPFATNGLPFDIPRLRTTLGMIDVDVATLIAQIVNLAPKLSPIFSGAPEAPTPPGGDDSNRIATTAFVQDTMGSVDTSTLAPKDSPTFIGAPKAPTPTPGDNTTRLATTAFVAAAVSTLVGAAPGALDTLNELAAALGNDPNFATTITAALANKADLSAALPVSAVVYLPRTTAPTGYLKANGAAYSRTTYAALFAVIGTTFGVGDGSTTFNVPDLRSEFIRGLDDGRGVDTGRALGAAQSSQNLSHSHAVTDPGHFHSISDPGHSHSVPLYYSSGSGSGLNLVNIGTSGSNVSRGSSSSATGISIASKVTGITIASDGGTEARPRNQALLAVIKY